MAKSRAIANLAVVISARTKRFEKGFALATKRLKRFGKSILRVTAGIRRFGMLLLGAIGIGSIAAFAASVWKSVQALDALAKSSDRLKIGPERLEGLRHAARLAGMDTEKLDQSLVYLRRRLSEAASGLSTSADAFGMLGLNIQDMLKLPLDQQLAKVADGMRRLTNQSDRVRVAMDLFGRSGAGMINLLAGGSKAMDDATAKLKQYGGAFSRFDLAKVEAFNDAMADLKKLMIVLRDKFTIRIATYMTIITEKLTAMVLGAADFGNVMVEGFVKAAGAAGVLLDTMRSIRKLHLQTKLGVLKARIPAELASTSFQNLGKLNRIFLNAAGIPTGRPNRTPASADLAGLLQTIAELEADMAELNLKPEFSKLGEWMAKLIAELKIEVRTRNAQIRANLQPGGLLGTIWRGMQSGLPGSLALGAAKEAEKGAAKYQWGQASQTRTAFPSGVGAIAQARKQPVQDEKLTSVVQSMWDWFKTNAPAQQAAWALVK